jgi:hypothetical protein
MLPNIRKTVPTTDPNVSTAKVSNEAQAKSGKVSVDEATKPFEGVGKYYIFFAMDRPRLLPCFH